MVAERSPSSTDAYIVARLALWAGDFDYAQNLLRDFAPLSKHGAMPDTVHNTEELIVYAAALRHRQLARRKGEFTQLAETISVPDGSLTPQPLVIATRHLRAAVWRVGARQFQMRAYMSDLTWEAELFRLSRAQVRELPEPSPPPRSAQPRHFVPLGTAWLRPGNPFVQIAISDLGLIQADALWTEAGAPVEFRPFHEAFKAVLESLENEEPANANLTSGA